MPTDPAGYISKQIIPQLPQDENQKNPAVIMGCIVTGNTIVGFLPLRCTDNGDGTATLVVEIAP